MSLKYELSRLAQNDLEGIWVYTFENWSQSQANKYYSIIMDEIRFICKNPDIGRPFPISKKSHRIRLIKSHMIIYKNDNGKIWVDRILHNRMDIESIYN